MRKYLLLLCLVILLVPASFGTLCFYSFSVLPWLESDVISIETYAPLPYDWQPPERVAATRRIHMVRDLGPFARAGLMEMPFGTDVTNVVAYFEETQPYKLVLYVTTQETDAPYEYELTGLQVVTRRNSRPTRPPREASYFYFLPLHSYCLTSYFLQQSHRFFNASQRLRRDLLSPVLPATE